MLALKANTEQTVVDLAKDPAFSAVEARIRITDNVSDTLPIPGRSGIHVHLTVVDLPKDPLHSGVWRKDVFGDI